MNVLKRETVKDAFYLAVFKCSIVKHNIVQK